MSQSLAILQFALTMEKQGETFFLDATEKVSQPEAKQLFKELAEWEHMHQQYIQQQIDSLQTSGRWAMPNQQSPFHQEKVTYDVFYRHDAAEGKEPTLPLSDKTTDLSVLRLALMIESDLHAFYQKALEHVSDPDGKTVLQTLVHWEAEHQTIIQEQYDALQKDFWSQMGFAPF